MKISDKSQGTPHLSTGENGTATKNKIRDMGLKPSSAKIVPICTLPKVNVSDPTESRVAKIVELSQSHVFQNKREKPLNNTPIPTPPLSESIEKSIEKNLGLNASKELKDLARNLSLSGCNIEDIVFFIEQVDALAKAIEGDSGRKKTFSLEKFKTAAYLIASTVISHTSLEADDKPLHTIFDFIDTHKNYFSEGKETSFSLKIARIVEKFTKNSAKKIVFTSGDTMAKFFLNPIAEISENKLERVIQSIGAILGKHLERETTLTQYIVSSVLHESTQPN